VHIIKICTSAHFSYSLSLSFTLPLSLSLCDVEWKLHTSAAFRRRHPLWKWNKCIMEICESQFGNNLNWIFMLCLPVFVYTCVCVCVCVYVWVVGYLEEVGGRHFIYNQLQALWRAIGVSEMKRLLCIVH